MQTAGRYSISAGGPRHLPLQAPTYLVLRILPRGARIVVPSEQTLHLPWTHTAAKQESRSSVSQLAGSLVHTLIHCRQYCVNTSRNVLISNPVYTEAVRKGPGGPVLDCERGSEELKRWASLCVPFNAQTSNR